MGASEIARRLSSLVSLRKALKRGSNEDVVKALAVYQEWGTIPGETPTSPQAKRAVAALLKSIKEETR